MGISTVFGEVLLLLNAGREISKRGMPLLVNI